jgi:hypothetical protein
LKIKSKSKIKSQSKSAQAERRVLSLGLRDGIHLPLPAGERVGVRGRAERKADIATSANQAEKRPILVEQQVHFSEAQPVTHVMDI